MVDMGRIKKKETGMPVLERVEWRILLGDNSWGPLMRQDREKANGARERQLVRQFKRAANLTRGREY